MKIVAHRPVRTACVLAAAGSLVAAALVLAFQFGFQRGRGFVRELQDTVRVQQLRIASLRESEASVRGELAQQSTGRLVGMEERKQTLAQLTDLRRKVSGLEQKLELYRDVMDLPDGRKGLVIERFEINATDEPRRMAYRMSLAQSERRRQVVEGQVQLRVTGARGKTLSYPDAGGVGFKFRYFQDIEGQFTLPEDFRPESVVVVANAHKPHNDRYERSFGWAVTGG